MMKILIKTNTSSLLSKRHHTCKGSMTYSNDMMKAPKYKIGLYCGKLCIVLCLFLFLYFEVFTRFFLSGRAFNKVQ